MNKGLLIVLYGPDGVGKSQQISLLEEKLRDQNFLCRTLRYPVYDSVSGKELDEKLHKRGGSVSEQQMQELFAKNRQEFEPTLRSWLDSGVTVITENYKGTGVAWGMVRGLPMEKMEEINRGTLDPDIAIFVDGPKRAEVFVDGHPYATEEGDDEWYRLRKVYSQLADKYGWVRVGGDAPLLTVASRVWAVVRPVLARR